MNTILVPTDFSQNAANALNYAIALAKRDDATILLLHAYQIPYVAGDTAISVTSEQIDAIRHGADDELKKLCAKALAKNVQCGYLNREGGITENILDTVVKKRINLVVMGTKGASGLKKVMIGSNTARVVQNAKCPVIAVPENATFKKIRKIAYATEYHSSDSTTIKKLLNISETFHAPLRLVHVTGMRSNEANQKEHLQKFTDKIKEKTGFQNINSQLLYGKNVETRLDEYVQEEHPDLLVMSTHYRTFTEKLFGKSTTKQIAYHTQVPLMVFHRKQKAAGALS